MLSGVSARDNDVATFDQSYLVGAGLAQAIIQDPLYPGSGGVDHSASGDSCIFTARVSEMEFPVAGDPLAFAAFRPWQDCGAAFGSAFGVS